MSSLTASKISNSKVAGLYDKYVMKNYGPAPLALVRGEGTYVWDADNRRYLDFVSGIAVNTLGHCHPKWTSAVQKQAEKLIHASNLYYGPEQGRLAQRLVEKAGPGRVYFCNSGAEANEFLIKLSRLWGVQKSGGQEGQCYKVITAQNSFHGRTFGGMSATPQAKIQKGFAPLLPGFEFAEFNNVESFAKAVDEQTSAIMLETIQGEGGIHPATPEFLQGIRELCDQHGLLMLMDEVQCGIGRTGKFFAFEHAGVKPDAIGMAKGLGGGFPIGAAWVATGYDELFTPGSHGTTFGGSPLGCAAAHAVLDILEEENLMDRIAVQAPLWHEALGNLVKRHPEHLAGVRGMGYHVALALHSDPLPWIARLRDNGLLTVRGGTDAIRLMPPLNVSATDLETAVDIIDLVFGTHSL
jgi:acetylornithine aminotransferase/acetylornithine/N-succinyldiaminopimelate aminotransferase